MQKLFVVAVIGMCSILFSCNSESKTEKMASKDTAAAEKIIYPYTATYSSSFEMGSPSHSEAVLKLWKSWDSGDLSVQKDLFADSVHLFFRDGTAMEGARDSILAGAQEFRNTFAKVESKVSAFFPVKSTDKNENWVCIWGTEVNTDKAGKIDSVFLQETWRLNKDGKIDLVYQYGAIAKPAK